MIVERIVQIVSVIIIMVIAIRPLVAVRIAGWRLTNYVRISYLFYFGPNLIHILIGNNIESNYTYYGQLLLIQYMGLLGLNMADYIFPRRRLVIPFSHSLRIRNRLLFFIVLAIIFLIRFYLLSNAVFGYGSNVEERSSFSGSIAKLSLLFSRGMLVLLAWEYYSKRSRNIGIFLVLLFCTETYIGLASGMKQMVVTPFILICLVYTGVFKQVPLKAILGVSPLIALLYPFINAYRNVINLGLSRGFFSDMRMVLDTLGNASLRDNMLLGMEKYSARLALADYLKLAIENLDSWSYYENMTRYFYLPVAWLIPTFIWKGQPHARNGEEFYTLLTGRGGNSVSVSTFGWSYLEGGLLFVLISFLIYGLSLNWIEGVVSKRLGSMSLVILVLLIPSLLKFENDIYFLVAGLLQTSLFYIVFIKIFMSYENSFHQ